MLDERLLKVVQGLVVAFDRRPLQCLYLFDLCRIFIGQPLNFLGFKAFKMQISEGSRS